MTDQGDVTGLSTGLATVTATTYDGAHTSSMAVSVNAPDTLQVDAYEGETTQGQALLGQLSALDSGGADLTYLLISQPAHGVVTVKENGRFTYYPDSGFNGADRFQFFALQADTGGAKFGQGTIDVTPVNLCSFAGFGMGLYDDEYFPFRPIQESGGSGWRSDRMET